MADADRLIITIDGPAGAGKSTLARSMARHLGWTYLDTGAMYRAVGLAAFEAGVDVTDSESMTRIMTDLDLRVAPGPDATRVFLGEREITSEIRQPHISGLASAASALGVVRQAMLHLQRRLGENGRIVAEGRDMGTVVFPDAGIKFFLDASLQERAHRRYLELLGLGEAVTLDAVTSDMQRRDAADSSRALAPLKPAPDAVHLDSTAMTIPEVLETMLGVVRARWGRID